MSNIPDKNLYLKGLNVILWRENHTISYRTVGTIQTIIRGSSLSWRWSLQCRAVSKISHP